MIAWTLRILSASMCLVSAMYMVPIVGQEGNQLLASFALGAFTTVACMLLVTFPELGSNDR